MLNVPGNRCHETHGEHT